MAALLEMRQIDKRFPGVRALSHIDVTQTLDHFAVALQQMIAIARRRRRRENPHPRRADVVARQAGDGAPLPDHPPAPAAGARHHLHFAFPRLDL
ncbi:hypothetical protein [Selenomonas sp.]|uniref:hypothetical protein n=1 Tax=Selenomonas sp. TaxID=2053611 RepID=UPI002A74BFC6|nr:hypothetical protein [Selenomonas sp.]MDY3296328.1 hypothetical protein [Selenomonas sp.]